MSGPRLDKMAGPPTTCHHCRATLWRNESSRQWVDEDGYVLCADKKHDHEPNLDDLGRWERERRAALRSATEDER